MSRRAVVAILLLSLASPPVIAEIPDIIHGREPGEGPVWVAGSYLTRNGEVDWSLLDEFQGRMVRSYIASARRARAMRPDAQPVDPTRYPRHQGCTGFSRINDGVSSDSLAEMAIASSESHLVRIEAARNGLIGARIETLYEVSIEQTLSGENREGSSLLIAYDGGRVEIEGTLLCTSTGRPESGPGPGYRALLFLDKDLESTAHFHKVSEERLIWERPNGSVSMPEWYQRYETNAKKPVSLDEALTEVEAALKESDGA